MRRSTPTILRRFGALGLVLSTVWSCSPAGQDSKVTGPGTGNPATGGTGGVSYLAKALELKFFPELWQVRTHLGQL